MSRVGAHGRPEAPRATWWDRLWQPFWTLPATIAAGSLVLGLLLPALDQLIGEPWPWVFEGGVTGARSVLGTIAGAMISVTGLVFSITMVVLQLASSQYSPRILGTFLESRTSQTTLGVFTGSFIYALTVLRKVGGGSDARVPQISVTVGYLYVLVAVALFLAFIHHITTSVQVSRVMSQVREQTIHNIRRLDPEPSPTPTWSPRPGSPRCVLAPQGRGGYVTVLDSTLLVGRARDLDVVVELDVAPGDYVTEGEPVGRVWGRGSLSDDEAAALVDGLHFGRSRTLHSDIGLGVRQLLDVAERALSPGVNDPTTALQAMNELHAVLRELSGRPDLSAYLTDDEHVVRAVYRPQTYARALAATVEELVHYGRESLRVIPRLRDVLADLAAAARPEHVPVTDTALAEVDRYVAEQLVPALTLDVRGKNPANP